MAPDERSASCWQAMFLNPLIVNGFPILARPENEPGLELPLGMMSDLAETHFATHYGSTLVLKGPCTMLVPTYRAERSITGRACKPREPRMRLVSNLTLESVHTRIL